MHYLKQKIDFTNENLTGIHSIKHLVLNEIKWCLAMMWPNLDKQYGQII